MIRGQVDSSRRVIITLTLTGPTGRQETIPFEFDTGFAGSLLIPLTVVERLELKPLEEIVLRLADGTTAKAWSYGVQVEWDGMLRRTRVVASGSQPLLGTSLPLGHRITFDLIDGGSVTITLLS